MNKRRATKKPAKRAKKKAAKVPNQRFGRVKTMPFKDVVGRLLETPPDAKPVKNP